MVKKAKQKKAKRGVKKVTAKATLSAKKRAPKQKAARKPAARRRSARQTQVVRGSQSVETVQLKRRGDVDLRKVSALSRCRNGNRSTYRTSMSWW